MHSPGTCWDPKVHQHTALVLVQACAEPEDAVSEDLTAEQEDQQQLCKQACFLQWNSSKGMQLLRKMPASRAGARSM